VSKHQDPAQLQATRHGRGDPRILPAIRAQIGFTRPSKANQLAFDRAVDQVAQAAHELLGSLVANTPPRDREVEAAKARARAAERFGSSAA